MLGFEGSNKVFFPSEPTERKDKSTRQMGDYSDLLLTVKGRLRAGFASVKGPYLCPPHLAPQLAPWAAHLRASVSLGNRHIYPDL